MFNLNISIKIILIGIVVYHFTCIYRRGKINGLDDREALSTAVNSTAGIFRNVASLAVLLIGLSKDNSDRAVEKAEVNHSNSHTNIGLFNLSHDEPTNERNTYDSTSSYLNYLIPTIEFLIITLL